MSAEQPTWIDYPEQRSRNGSQKRSSVRKGNEQVNPVRKRMWQPIMPLLLATVLMAGAEDIVQETATIEFDPAFLSRWDSSVFPAWVLRAGTVDGKLDPVERCWSADDSLPYGKGQCWIDIDRDALQTDLALTLMFEAAATSDVVIQLWNDAGSVVAIDLFMNIIEEATWLKTHTFVVPLLKYPSASRLVIRRLSGDVKIHGVVLTPVVSEANGDFGELLALARRLGDPLSPENPVVVAVRTATRKKQPEDLSASGGPEPMPGAAPGTTSADPYSMDTSALAAYYDFEEVTAEGIFRDKSGNGLDLSVIGKPASTIPGVSGNAVLMEGFHLEARQNPLVGAKDFTISIWFKTAGPTANYKLASAAWWRGGYNASGWNVGTHYSQFWADNREGNLEVRDGWARRVPFLAGEWNHLVIVYNRERLREYINGQLSFECPGTGRNVGSGRALTVGAWMGGFRFRGLMDELRIYRRALGEQEISSVYNAVSPATKKVSFSREDIEDPSH